MQYDEIEGTNLTKHRFAVHCCHATLRYAKCRIRLADAMLKQYASGAGNLMIVMLTPTIVLLLLNRSVVVQNTL